MTQTLAKHYPHQSIIINLLLVLSLVGFAVGIFSPLLTLQKFFIYSDTISLVSGIQQLLEQKYYTLFAIILLFSIIFPLAKIIIVYITWNFSDFENQSNRLRLNRIAHYSKWSMLDVFVVALLVVTVKLDAIAKVDIHHGLYLFAGSVVMTMLATARVITLANQFSQD